MKKYRRIFAAALLVLLSFFASAFAVSALPLKIEAIPAFPEETTTMPTAASKLADALSSLQNFWHAHGILIIVVLVLLCIVAAITISEKEQEKKRVAEREKKPHRKHEK